MEGTGVSLLKTENGRIPVRYQSFGIGESGSNTVNVPLFYIHGGISDEINAGPLQQTVSFSQSVFFWMPKVFRCLASTSRSRKQIRVKLWMTRALWETDLSVFEDKNRKVTWSANDDSLGLCADMVVEHAVDSAVL
jgi:hypothetical protein